MKTQQRKPFLVVIVSILLALFVGGLSGFLTKDSMQLFEQVPKSSLTPPALVFPIVWSILFLLMGIGAARVLLARAPGTPAALWVYGIQLVVNFFWSIFFFNLQAYLFSFLWLILLWGLVLLMILLFAAVDRPGALLQIPYLLWLTFAGYLNGVIWLLNR